MKLTGEWPHRKIKNHFEVTLRTRRTGERLGILLMGVSCVLSAADSTFDRALNEYNRTDFAAAVALLKPASDARSLELLGKSWLMEGEFHKATDALEKAAELDPRSSEIQMWLGRAYGRRAETAFAFNAMSLAIKSREAFEKAIQLDSANKDALGDLFDFYIGAPGIVGGGVEKARSLMPLVAKYDPGQLDYAQGQIDEQQKQLSSAEAHLRRAAESTPLQIGQVLNLARFLALHGRYEESEQEFLRAERLFPDSPRVTFARAETYVKTGRNPDQARELLKKYLAAGNLTPDDPPRADAMKLLKKIEGR
jgi:tetratricopeptide (TPR) repeat protein